MTLFFVGLSYLSSYVAWYSVDRVWRFNVAIVCSIILLILAGVSYND